MRNASSILLLANGPAKGFLSGPATVGAATNACAESAIRVLMIKRHTKARFMANMYVFPGGVLEETDGNVTKESLDPFRLGAVRELWEETSVSIGDDGAVAGRAPAPLYGIAPSLTPFAHWVTPVSERYRYDTWFFAHKAANDAEATALDMAQCPNELADLKWVSPHEALDMHRSDTDEGFRVPPPTFLFLDWLSKFPTSEAFMNSIACYNSAPTRSVPTVLPVYEGKGAPGGKIHIPSGHVHLPDGEYPARLFSDDGAFLIGDALMPKAAEEK